jgi:predicted dehydrogenase
MAPIRVGFVGLSSTGWAASDLAQPLLSTGKYTITAVSTTNEASAAASAEVQSKAQGNQPVKAYHGDTRSISNDPNVDVVAISVKTPDHANAALAAIEAGKDVFIEWPVGIGLAETKKLAEAAKAKGVRSLIGIQRRYNPAIIKVCICQNSMI